MEEQRNQPWGTRPSAYSSCKVEPDKKCDNRGFDNLFEGLQVTKEDQVRAAAGGTGTKHEKERQHMNMDAGDGINGSKNPFDDSPPRTATRRHENDYSERDYTHRRPDEEESATRSKGTRTVCSSFVEVAMRLTVVVLLLLAFILIASDSKTTKLGYVLGQVTLKFTYFDAFKYLLSASMIACGFSVIQLVPELYRMHTGEVLIQPEVITLYFNFICDQFIAYLLLSSTSAGMTASDLVRKGYDVVWLSLCSGTGFWSFCAQAAASVSMAFLAFLIMASLALLSGFRLAKYLVFA